MKVVFVSNSFNHHQQYFIMAMSDALSDDFHFIETRPLRAERIALGWGREEKPACVLQHYLDEQSMQRCQKLIDDADVVIHGSAPLNLLKQRLRQHKLTLFYSERVYKSGCPYYKLWWHLLLNIRNGFWKRSSYLLCASAYTAYDFARTLTFMGRCFKWGYFPETKHYDVDKLLQRKRENSKTKILWAGRFLVWKHPEVPIRMAERLKQDGYDFEMNLIGRGDLEAEIQHMIEMKGLQEQVHMLGTMLPEQVREHMETANIYLFTSDFNEGWGAVANESMNSACAVLANHAIGSVPFLIRDGENGLIYQNGNLDDMYTKLKQLIKQPDRSEQLGRNAFYTITNTWNAQVAADRLLHLSTALFNGQKPDLSEDGPCSKAKILRNHWYHPMK